MSEARGGAAGQDLALRKTGIPNPVGSIVLVCLAFAPQLTVLAYAFVSAVLSLFPFGPRVPMTSGFEMFKNLALDRNLLTFYSLPLIAIGIFTLFPRIRAARDYYGGVAMIAIALFAYWASSDLSGMRGISFGPGTAPRMFAGLLVLLGVAIAITGLLSGSEPLARFAFRGPFFVTVSILLFSVAIRPLGLIVSGIATFLIAAMGSPETRWFEAIIIGVLLTLFCAFLFPYVLGLPFQLLPQFMQ